MCVVCRIKLTLAEGRVEESVAASVVSDVMRLADTLQLCLGTLQTVQGREPSALTGEEARSINKAVAEMDSPDGTPSGHAPTVETTIEMLERMFGAKVEIVSMGEDVLDESTEGMTKQ